MAVKGSLERTFASLNVGGSIGRNQPECKWGEEQCLSFPQVLRPFRDKVFVSRFVKDAMNLLEAAEQAAHAGNTASDLTILISREGGIHMIAGSDWPLDSLQFHHGARTAYRVSEHASKVRVEGREAGRTCVFETESPERAARILLGQIPLRTFAARSGLIS